MSAVPSEVLCHRHDGWAELVLNRPERRNAIDGLLADALLAHLTSLRADESVRALVLRGEGGALCSGLDLKAFNAEPPPEWLPRFAAHLACGAPGAAAVPAGAGGGAGAFRHQRRRGAGHWRVICWWQAKVPTCRWPRCRSAWPRPRTSPGWRCATARRWPRTWRCWATAGMLRNCCAAALPARWWPTTRWPPAPARIAQRIAGFPPQGPLRIKSALRAASLRMAAVPTGLTPWRGMICRPVLSNAPPKNDPGGPMIHQPPFQDARHHRP